MKITKIKKTLCFMLTVIISLTGIMTAPAMAATKKDLSSAIDIKWSLTNYTIYTNQYSPLKLLPTVGYSITPDLEPYRNELSDLMDQARDQWVWSTSESSVVAFVSSYDYDDDNNRIPILSDKFDKPTFIPYLYGVSPGTAEITATSPVLKRSITRKVTVVDSELWCEDAVFYHNNKYNFELRGNASAVSFASSNPEVATVDKTTGVVKTLKKGKTTISCIGTDGNTYEKKIKVKKSGLSYSAITSYYFTGSMEGYYDTFPIVAKGINVKNWTSSNTKVVKVLQKENIGVLEIHGTGKATVTCTDTSGKTYKCNVTIVGGKPWSGLRGGYRPTIEEVKKHGYYKDIGKIQDFGNVVFYIVDYAKEIDLKNGNKVNDPNAAEKKARELLENRYPEKCISQVACGDLLGFTSGSKYGRLWVGCYYAEDYPTYN